MGTAVRWLVGLAAMAAGAVSGVWIAILIIVHGITNVGDGFKGKGTDGGQVAVGLIQLPAGVFVGIAILVAGILLGSIVLGSKKARNTLSRRSR